MIEVYHNNILIAEAKNLIVIRNNFNINNDHKSKTVILSKAQFSKKFNITITLKEVQKLWVKNQSITFHKLLQSNE